MEKKIKPFSHIFLNSDFQKKIVFHLWKLKKISLKQMKKYIFFTFSYVKICFVLGFFNKCLQTKNQNHNLQFRFTHEKVKKKKKVWNRQKNAVFQIHGVFSMKMF